MLNTQIEGYRDLIRRMETQAGEWRTMKQQPPASHFADTISSYVKAARTLLPAPGDSPDATIAGLRDVVRDMDRDSGKWKQRGNANMDARIVEKDVSEYANRLRALVNEVAPPEEAASPATPARSRI